MSDGDDVSALRVELEQSIMTTYCEVAALAFLVYDHILTLPGEVKLVWGRKFTGATALFMLIRYTTLVSKVALLVTAFAWPNQTDKPDFFVITVSILIHSSAIASDTLVIVLTWVKTFGLRRVAARLHLRGSLSSILLRDGTVYFAIILALNAVQLATEESNVIWNPVPIFIDVFTTILISRFILNLRQVFDHSQNPNQDLSTFNSNGTFTVPRFVGNLGAELEHSVSSPHDVDVELFEDSASDGMTTVGGSSALRLELLEKDEENEVVEEVEVIERRENGLAGPV
ncbi:hypothetical protein EIP91_009611 [Steccherinum ochraceum]|uniref:DUF6533 domain-containing protein n=1 Tax=Steccherinum ochraceum TaxID=92696 RepID=A0A4R0R453_9APHY|nr:hypothetical protein EIP91_009611 [Steccherinum ochraceum]